MCIVSDELHRLRAVSLINGICRNDTTLHRRLECKVQERMVSLTACAFQTFGSEVSVVLVYLVACDLLDLYLHLLEKWYHVYVHVPLVACVCGLRDVALVGLQPLRKVVLNSHISYAVAFLVGSRHTFMQVLVTKIVLLQHLVQTVVGFGLGAFLCVQSEGAPLFVTLTVGIVQRDQYV